MTNEYQIRVQPQVAANDGWLMNMALMYAR